MCGRYILRERDLIRYGLGLEALGSFEEFSEKRIPMFNIAPSYQCPVVRVDAQGRAVLSTARWGLVPSWTKGKPKLAPINAKSETAATSGMFRQALERRRCLVPADGFYEWKGATPPKQPFFIHRRDDRPFAFAGIWERWTPAAGSSAAGSSAAGEIGGAVDTFAILTCAPNQLMAAIHNRMPVILAEADYARWLDRSVNAGGVADLMKPFNAEAMEAWPVSTKVNKPANDGPELMEKV